MIQRKWLIAGILALVLGVPTARANEPAAKQAPGLKASTYKLVAQVLHFLNIDVPGFDVTDDEDVAEPCGSEEEESCDPQVVIPQSGMKILVQINPCPWAQLGTFRVFHMIRSGACEAAVPRASTAAFPCPGMAVDFGMPVPARMCGSCGVSAAPRSTCGVVPSCHACNADAAEQVPPPECGAPADCCDACPLAGTIEAVCGSAVGCPILNLVKACCEACDAQMQVCADKKCCCAEICRCEEGKCACGKQTTTVGGVNDNNDCGYGYWNSEVGPVKFMGPLCGFNPGGCCAEENCANASIVCPFLQACGACPRQVIVVQQHSMMPGSMFFSHPVCNPYPQVTMPCMPPMIPGSVVLPNPMSMPWMHPPMPSSMFIPPPPAPVQYMPSMTAMPRYQTPGWIAAPVCPPYGPPSPAPVMSCPMLPSMPQMPGMPVGLPFSGPCPAYGEPVPMPKESTHCVSACVRSGKVHLEMSDTKGLNVASEELQVKLSDGNSWSFSVADDDKVAVLCECTDKSTCAFAAQADSVRIEHGMSKIVLEGSVALKYRWTDCHTGGLVEAERVIFDVTTGSMQIESGKTKSKPISSPRDTEAVPCLPCVPFVP